MAMRLRLAGLFTDGCVLQSGMAVPVWGWCEPRGAITVSLARSVVRVRADDAGSWSVRLGPLPAGGPWDLAVVCASGESIRRRCYAGEVFLCSGQSNMELPMDALRHDFPQAFSQADDPLLRYAKVAVSYDLQRRHLDMPDVDWKPCDAANLGSCSAVAYWFGRSVRQLLDVPVGLIDVSLGGSPIASWMDRESLRGFPDVLRELDSYVGEGVARRHSESSLEAIERWHRSLREGALIGCAMEGDFEDGRFPEGDVPEENARNGAACHEAVPVKAASHERGRGWASMSLPASFRGTELEGLCGTVEWRRTLYLPHDPTDHGALLRLGTWSDSDETFVNGHQVGSASNQYESRDYEVAPGIMREGANEIRVLLTCERGTGRVTPGKAMTLLCDGESHDLSGRWRYRVVSRADRPCPVEDFVRWKPTGLFNAMLAPCVPYAVRAVLWYQGESDTGGNAGRYGAMLASMIGLWRGAWGQERLPFLVVQLPGFAIDCVQDGGWPLVREAQMRVSSAVEDVAAVVALDAGEWNDLHPRGKRLVADRLFAAARAMLYGGEDTYPGMVGWSWDAERGELSLRFASLPYGRARGSMAAQEDAQSMTAARSQEAASAARPETCTDRRSRGGVGERDLRLATLDGDDPGEFTALWEDAGITAPLAASIDGDTVRLALPDRLPSSVRYAWSNDPHRGLLCDGHGIPVSPFRVQVMQSRQPSSRDRPPSIGAHQYPSVSISEQGGQL